MKLELIAEWRRAWKFASVQMATLLTLSFSLVPVAAEQWPNVAPSFVSWFPKNGQQWAPIIGSALVIAARLVKRRDHE